MPLLFHHVASHRLRHALLPWWITCASTTTLKLALARWKPPWLMLLLLGNVVGCLLVLPYSNWLTGTYEARWIAGTGAHPVL
jgi:hypothetical protein